ncbi:hypothetical protein Cgig2_024554 [Carnegiea gigantea]|uniref:Aminotransferase-like plant mobile domain-containing protein n=1 Tax=Carnegiea gigantea TaxID=171969 RepID=A0A9Q1H124_9CARY|nr:hypothetical protein Cgig2_024554 [Carnegiea gigantea]
MWSPVLKYKPFVMDRHLVRTLVESWVPESKAFRIGWREVPFSVYDVALLTGLPATGRHVTFDQREAPCEVEDVVKAAMDDHMSRERARRQTGRANMRMYWNYVSVIIELCKQNNTPDRLGLFTKLYALLVISALLFPRTPGGVTWELIKMTKNGCGMTKYNWSQAVWSFLVEAIEDTKEKIPLKKNLQMHGFATILQVWFYEHTSLYAHADEKCVPRIASWVNLYISRKYDAGELISSIEDNQVGYLSCKILPFLEVRDLERGEVTVKAFNDIDDFNAYVEDAQGIIRIEEQLRRTREALWTTKEALTIERVAHAATKKELGRLRALLMGMGHGDSVLGSMQYEGLQCADEDGEGTVHAGEGRVCTSPGEDMHSFRTKIESANVGSGEDAQERDPFGEGKEPVGKKEMVASPAATEDYVLPTVDYNTTRHKRMQAMERSPRRQQPSAKQVSPYVNPIAAVHTGKCTMRNMYTSRKQCRKASSTTSKEQKVEDIGVAATEVAMERTTVMAVVIPAAAAGNLDDGVGGIYDTVGHSEEEQLTKTEPVTERTTAVGTIQTGAARDAAIHQDGGWEHMDDVVVATDAAEEAASPKRRAEEDDRCVIANDAADEPPSTAIELHPVQVRNPPFT